MKRLAWIAWAAVTLGCAPAIDIGNTDTDSDTPPDGSSEDTGTAPAPTTTGGGVPGSSTSTVTTSPPTATDPTMPDGSSAGTTPDDESSGSSSETSDGTDGLLDGERCMLDTECASGSCYVLDFFGTGWCGECSSDADCALGCNAPNPLAGDPIMPVCGSGNVGDTCETEDACGGDLLCVELVNAPGALELSGCSQCDSNDDCLPGTVCAKQLDLANFSGAWTCIAEGSLPQGAICDDASGGDLACASGACSMTDVVGLVPIGVCSDCDEDTPCAPGDTCTAAEVGLDGSTFPGECQ